MRGDVITLWPLLANHQVPKKSNSDRHKSIPGTVFKCKSWKSEGVPSKKIICRYCLVYQGSSPSLIFWLILGQVHPIYDAWSQHCLKKKSKKYVLSKLLDLMWGFRICKFRNRSLKAPFSLFLMNEKTTFYWSKVVSEAIFPTKETPTCLLIFLKGLARDR